MLNTNTLADQIKESTNRSQLIAAVDQDREVKHCSGPEEVIELFIQALNKYPASVLRLPISTILLEVTSDGCVSKRKMRKVLKQIEVVLRTAVGDSGVALRCGRYQFAFLLTGVNDVTAGKICQRIKEAIHQYCYFKLKLKQQLNLEFAISQHQPSDRNDFADLVFSNDQTIRIARALGDGAIVTRRDVKERFQRHEKYLFHIGEVSPTTVFELNDL